MKYINTIGFIIVFLLTSVVAQAQKVGGNVTGTVVDKNTKEPIAHVQVFVKGTTLVQPQTQTATIVLRTYLQDNEP
ncbi:carboxypeptidase-like regulatory domain-containing protein [Porphyromonas gingivicanis]|uniref:carboxypeptidase-like regulatory domain-containing protein n=1 Tax=Porphyromonas gingivicanis TaxID=266762 RepID=UPI001F5A9CEE|nr:carboxypeptidase-like regulatory domain-containing protein [Porphyromonas gingivicanis]